MWIHHINVGIKRSLGIFGLLVIGALSLYTNYPLISYLLTGMSLSLTILLLIAMYKFGMVIRIHTFFVGSRKLEVQDFFYPNNPKANKRSLIDTQSGSAYSVMFHKPQHHWAILDIIGETLHLSKKKIRHALVLGAGGCTVPYCLLRDALADDVDAVELNLAIIGIAKRFFLPQAIPKSLHIFQADAADYIASCKTHYDFILVDIFDGQRLAPQLQRIQFARNLRRILKKDGILIINFGYVINDIQHTFHGMKQFFSDLILLYIHKNFIGISGARVPSKHNTHAYCKNNLPTRFRHTYSISP